MTIAAPIRDAFGNVTPLDGGPPVPPDQPVPQPLHVSFHELLSALNPLQHVPVVGTIYRAATGDTIPLPLQVAGSLLTGGPPGALGAAVVGFLTELIRMGPDTSRPPAPMGMSVTGSEAGMQPVTPGQPTEKGGYTTLATTIPDFLRPRSFPPKAATAVAAYQQGGGEWARTQWLEKGLA